MGSFAWDGCRRSIAGPYPANHLQYALELLAARDLPTLFAEHVVADVAESVLFDGPETFF